MNRFHKMCLIAFGLFAAEFMLALGFSSLRIPVLALIGLECIILILLPVWKNREKRTKIPLEDIGEHGQFIKLNQGYVRYKLKGNADSPLVIMINGFPMPYEIWDHNAEQLAAGNYRVLQFDLWGFGYSDRRLKNYDADVYCSQIQQLLLKLNLDQPVHIAAFSMGCTIAARLLETTPKVEVAKAVLIGPVVNPMPISPFHWPLVGEYLTSLFIGKAMGNIFAGNFHQNTDREALQRAFFAQLQYKGFRRAWLSFYRNLFPKATLQAYKRFAEKGIPVTIISGKEDRIVPLSDSRLLHQEMGWPLTIVEGGGHSVQYECAERVNTEMLKFLKGDAYARKLYSQA